MLHACPLSCKMGQIRFLAGLSKSRPGPGCSSLGLVLCLTGASVSSVFVVLYYFIFLLHSIPFTVILGD